VIAAPAAAAATPGVAAPPPLSLYLHLPWCLRKCPYCDFNSHEWRAGAQAAPLPEARYLDALEADLEAALPLVWGRVVQTVFIGGGTPSLFSPESIDRLLQSVRARLRLAPGAEITMEANPGTFEAARFRAYAQVGVNRLSIGVQSFDDAALHALGRVHDADQAHRAVALAAECFDSFNIDLMYALPGQDLRALEKDLRIALSHEPPHLSCYHLTIEPNTLFAHRPPQGLPDDDLAAQMQSRIEALTEAAGLVRYEVSAYAREGHRCRHNLNYWQFGDYLGIGAGAHGKLSFHDRIIRQVRLKHPREYIDAALDAGRGAVEATDTVNAARLPFEFMLNALRLVDGVPADLFEQRTGLSLAVIGRELARTADRGLLDPDPRRLRPTPLGGRFLNDLLQEFLQD
jgi:putative oxygen-independent coproporphyrinogen III oxidase